MEWFFALPSLVVAVAVLVTPGLLLAWVLGFRQVWLVSLSPVLTTFLVAATTLALKWLKVSWHLGTFTASAAVIAGILLVLMRVLRKRWWARFDWRHREQSSSHAYWLALLSGVLLLTMRYAQIIEHPGNINQGIDTPFHVNVVQQILDSGDGSPFTVQSLMGESTGFYPQIWHALTALTAQATSLPVVQAANALNFAIVAVAWPVGVLLLVYVVVGPKLVALLGAAVSSAAFFAFPFTVMQSQKSDFGPLFPYMLAVTLLPPLMALFATALGFGKNQTMPWALAAVTLALALPGLVCTHMSAVVALVGLTSFFALIGAVRSFIKLRRRHSDAFAYLQWAAFWISACASGLVIWAVVRPWTSTWDPIDPLPAAIGAVLLTAPTHGQVAWAPAALTLLGMLLLMFRPTERWFLASYAGAVTLYLVAAAVPTPLVREIIIGAWYGDPPRLAALLPMFWAVFVGAACDQIFERLIHFQVKWVVPVGIAALGVSIIIWPTNSETTPGRERTYAFGDASPLLTPDELELMNRLQEHVPDDAVIANNPWDGSSTAYAIADRRVLFAHAYTGSNADRLLAAQKLNQATPGSDVCRAAKSEHIEFLLDLGGRYIDPKRKEVNDFPGLKVPDGSPAFVKVDQQGAAVLYRFVGCDS